MDCPIRKGNSCPQLPGTTGIMVSEYLTHTYTHTRTHTSIPLLALKSSFLAGDRKRAETSRSERTVALRLKADLYLKTALACSCLHPLLIFACLLQFHPLSLFSLIPWFSHSPAKLFPEYFPFFHTPMLTHMPFFSLLGILLSLLPLTPSP